MIVINGVKGSSYQFPSSVVCDLTNLTQNNSINLRIIRSVELKNVTLALQPLLIIEFTQSKNKAISNKQMLIETTMSLIITNVQALQKKENRRETTFNTLTNSLFVQMADSLDSLLIKLNVSKNNYGLFQNVSCTDFIKDLAKLGGSLFLSIKFIYKALPTCIFNNSRILIVYFGENPTILPNETILLKKAILKLFSTIDFSSDSDGILEFQVKSPISPVNFIS